MKKKLSAVLLMVFLSFSSHAWSEEVMEDPVIFSRNNPDGEKYSFVKHYIMALEYYRDNEKLVGGLGVLSQEDLADDNLVRRQMDNLLRANTNLRVARNILGKYSGSRNALMRKIAGDFSAVCNDQIAINNQEREMWNELINSVKEIVLGFYDVGSFNQRYRDLAEKRKTSLGGLLQASILSGKVLFSPKLNEYGHYGFLGISKDERFKLIKRLDEGFTGDNFKGELRDGQTFLEASVVSLREVLENFRTQTLDG